MANSLLRKAQNRIYNYFDKEKEKVWNGPFYFIQGADPQLGMIESYIEKKEDPKWDKEMKLVDSTITKINLMNPRPRFFVVCGDLINAMPGTKLCEAQEKDFIKGFSALHPDIPLVCVCGNHDIGNTPTSLSIENYQNKFGDDYFTFVCSGVMFIVLNSQFFEDPSLVQDLANEQEKWLDQQLEEAKTGNYKHVIIFQHIPWFLEKFDEEKDYFNILPELRMKMLSKFYDANIRAIFCGHYHRNAGGKYKDLELVVTSAIGAQLGVDKSGFRIVKIFEDSIQHAYYPIEDAPTSINL